MPSVKISSKIDQSVDLSKRLRPKRTSTFADFSRSISQYFLEQIRMGMYKVESEIHWGTR